MAAERPMLQVALDILVLNLTLRLTDEAEK